MGLCVCLWLREFFLFFFFFFFNDTATTEIYTLSLHDALPISAAITRLQDMGVESYLVASVLEGVLAQRLLRRICQACREPHRPPAAEVEALGIAAAADAPIFRGRGCDECRGTGYRGRTA